jgi:hypothetical protein
MVVIGEEGRRVKVRSFYLLSLQQPVLMKVQWYKVKVPPFTH